MNKFLTFVIVALLISCSQTTKKKKLVIQENTGINQQQLNFLGQWYNEGKRETLLRNFVREYEFQNQHIDVNLKFPDEVYFDRSDNMSDPRFIYTTITQDASEWDIIRINGDYSGVATYGGDYEWTNKYLVDFSKMPEFMKNINPQIDVEKIKKKWNGIIPGPIIEGQYYALWVNTDLAKKIDITVKQYGMTAEDFISYVKAANEYNKNASTPITVMHDAADWSTITGFVLQLYGSLVNDPNTFNDLKFTNERLAAWFKTLDFLEELSKLNVLSSDARKISWHDTRFDLLEEKCLFYSNGSWMYNIWVEENAEITAKCMPCEYPVFNEVQFFPGSYEVMWGVPKNAKNKQEAIDFLIAMNNPTMADSWVRLTKCPTGIKGNLADVTFGTDAFENFSSHIQNKYKTNLYYVRSSGSSIFGKAYETMELHHKKVLLGEMTANQVKELVKNYISEMQ